MTPAHVRVGSTVGRCVAEVTPPFDDLFRRAAADRELEPTVADQVGRPGILDHVERVLVPHVDDSRADLDSARSGTDCREKRKWGRELLGKMMDAKVRPIRAELLRGDGQLDGLMEDVA